MRKLLLRTGLSWTHVLRQTALLVFVIQYVRWLQNYWLTETSVIVYATVAVVFAVELLFVKWPLWIRLLFHGAGMIAAIFIVLTWNPLELGWSSWQMAGEAILSFAGQFFPYMWFGLGAWAVYIVLNMLLLTREQVFLATVMSVIGFAIADSYSSIYLWDETVLIVISGLILMVNRHFAEFRDKHPHTWKYISEYPWGITLTAGTLVAFIVLMSTISPNVRPLLVDPYTAWNQLQGKSVNFSVKDDTQTALASFGLNLMSNSGYGRDDSQLGGGFNYNYDPVFKVTSSVRSYWRGESKSVYTGSGWVDSGELDDIHFFQIGEDIEPEWTLDESVPVNEFTQQVVMIDEDDPPRIFGAYPIKRIESVNGTDDIGDRFAKNMRTGAVDKASYDDPIRGYTVTSAVPVMNSEQLMQLQRIEITPELREYVQLPETLPNRVYELVEEITAEAGTPYEKVKAIEAYLQTNYAYTNTPEESRGTSEDFVDRFLFEILEGYCDYFSTAMAVMVRTLDIPARWVKGYTTGIMDEESTMMYEQYLQFSGGVLPDMEATYTVRNSDAHSWVEVYFEGYGWVMFEPTAGFVAPVISAPAEETPIVAEVPEPDTTVSESPVTGTESVNYTAMIVTAVAVIVAGLAIWLFRGSESLARLQRIRLMMVRAGLMRPPANPNEQIVNEFNRLLRFFKRKGLVREEHQTVREAISAWGGQYPSVNDKLTQVLYGFEQAKYSSRTFTDQDVERYQNTLRELRQQIKRIA